MKLAFRPPDIPKPNESGGAPFVLLHTQTKGDPLSVPESQRIVMLKPLF